MHKHNVCAPPAPLENGEEEVPIEQTQQTDPRNDTASDATGETETLSERSEHGLEMV
jgi:hypothetical protein